MSNKKHPYTYTIKTKQGETITNRMNKGIELSATKESMARKILGWVYPGCEIIHIKNNSMLFTALMILILLTFCRLINLSFVFKNNILLL